MASSVLSPELKARLAPLLRLQASDNDGERANASAMIGKLLKRHGADWHDLVEVLLAERQRAPDPDAGASTWKRKPGAIELPRGQLLELLGLIEQRVPFLPFKSAAFVASLRSRTWRPTVHLSEKQWAWLQDLLEATGV